MTLAAQKELTQDPQLLYRVSTDGYHRMLESGAIVEGAPFELLDGYIVHKIRSAEGDDPVTVSPHHATAVTRLAKLDSRLARYGCHIQTQQPIALPPFDEPEPDGAIVRGTIDDYRSHHPAAGDVICVIEVADASLGRDRGYKQQLYAGAGIGAYVIVNLIDRSIELYTGPSKSKRQYRTVETIVPRQSITLPMPGGKSLRVPARQLLP